MAVRKGQPESSSAASQGARWIQSNPRSRPVKSSSSSSTHLATSVGPEAKMYTPSPFHCPFSNARSMASLSARRGELGSFDPGAVSRDRIHQRPAQP